MAIRRQHAPFGAISDEQVDDPRDGFSRRGYGLGVLTGV